MDAVWHACGKGGLGWPVCNFGMRRGLGDRVRVSRAVGRKPEYRAHVSFLNWCLFGLRDVIVSICI